MDRMSIAFPNLGIYLDYVPKSFQIGSFTIAMYGIIIATGVLLGFMLANYEGNRVGMPKDIWWDFSLPAIIFSVLGARIYYVIFSWDYYKNNLKELLNTRQGGLAIYGGVIGGFLTLFIFCKIRKVRFLQMTDAGVMGLLLGQIIGRWGNFTNREVFGGYTDNLFAMRLPIEMVRQSDISPDIAAHITDGINYIQVHPTFLYEGLWNLGILLFLLWFRKRKRITGEMFYIYGVLYGLGRFFIEGLRTDQLLIFGKIPVSQIVAVACMVVFTTLLIQGRIKNKPEYIPPLSTTEE